MRLWINWFFKFLSFLLLYRKRNEKTHSFNTEFQFFNYQRSLKKSEKLYSSPVTGPHGIRTFQSKVQPYLWGSRWKKVRFFVSQAGFLSAKNGTRLELVIIQPNIGLLAVRGAFHHFLAMFERIKRFCCPSNILIFRLNSEKFQNFHFPA